MELKKEKIVAYWLAGILLVVGVVCYAAFPQKRPEQPIRIMLENTAGNVLLDHKKHASEDGYGIECKSCHHDLEEEGAKAGPCGECHDAESEVKRSDAFHKQCKGCHEEDGTAPVKCEGCHVL